MKYDTSTGKVFLFTFVCLIFTIFTQGLVVSTFKLLIPSISFSPGVYLSYVIYPVLILFLLPEIKKDSFNISYLLFIFVILFFLLIKSLFQYEQIEIGTLFRIVNYCIPIVFLICASVVYDNDSVLKKVNFLVNSIIVISIIQLIFKDYLPSSFVEPPLVGDSTASSTVYIGGIAFMKANGTIGNPLEFASFLILSLFFKLFFYRDKSLNLMIFIVVVNLLNMLLFSRLSLVLLLFVSFFYLFFISRDSYRYKVILAVIISIVIFSIPSKYYSDSVEFMHSRLFSDLASDSDDAHLLGFQYVFSLISDHPILGMAPSSDSVNYSLITDGFWITSILEFGIPLFTLFMILFFLPLVYVFLKTRIISRNLVLLLLLVLSVFCISISNSSLHNKINYMFFWFLYGLYVFNSLNKRKITYKGN